MDREIAKILEQGMALNPDGDNFNECLKPFLAGMDLKIVHHLIQVIV